MAKVSKTQQILIDMLTENTGSHFLDSGGAYGRNWERNQGRDFLAEPESSLYASWGLNWSHNLFHWLDSRLEFDAKLDSAFKRFCNRPENNDESYLGLMESFVESLEDRHEVGGIYGEGKPFTVNTYNGEDMLSQVIQYVFFTMDETPYIVLSIHGGCDVRGGYTTPRVFRVVGDGESIFANAEGTISCNQCGAYWDTEDAGYSFFESGYSGDGHNEPVPLDKLNLIGDKKDRSDNLVWYLDYMWKLDGVIDFAKIAHIYGDENILYALETGEVVCPCCGKGILKGSFQEGY